jgi:glycosyltransferase involved in cell wall biosynthesis
MCEAMSSGLVPVTSPTGGIPEYAEDGKSAFLCDDAAMIAERIEYLYHNPTVFLQMSTSARQAILDKCSAEIVVPKELALISAVAKR